MKTLLASLFGKYRDLILAIAVFLVIDAGVSVINIYTSRQIEADASLINHAGLLRTYSQQLTKGLLTLDHDLRQGALTQSSLAEISEARAGFDEARSALSHGLAIVPLFAFLDARQVREEADEQLRQVVRTWDPIDREVGPLLLNAPPDLDSAASAIQQAVNRNNKLTRQASDLADNLEEMARQKAQTVRVIQGLAILLAVINFTLILFKFIGRLASSDRETAVTREETERILGTVRQGLFLLTKERRIGAQRSKSLEALFGERLRAGVDFHDFLREIVPADATEGATDYIDLLFNKKMKQSLLAQLNPLHEIEVRELARLRKGLSHLSFEFDQIRESGQVVALLVSVFDVSQKVQLQRELAGAEARAKSEIALLLDVLDHNPHEVGAFLERARDALQLVNGELQDFQPLQHSYIQLVNRIARIVHSLKGEAGALGCNSLVRESHAFEEALQPLRRRADLTGDDLIPVAVALNRLLGEILKVETIVRRVRQFAGNNDGQDPGSPLDEQLRRLERYTLQIAEDLNKQVRFEAVMPSQPLPSPVEELLREAVPQLVRNAIAHGIESPAERLRLGKPADGLIRVEIHCEPDGQYGIAVHDDGCGLSATKLRQLLVERQHYSAAEVAAMDDQQVIATLFQPGLSTLANSSEHAGRGDGLAVVKAAVARLGARLRIQSRPDSHTRFLLQLSHA